MDHLSTNDSSGSRLFAAQVSRCVRRSVLMLVCIASVHTFPSVASGQQPAFAKGHTHSFVAEHGSFLLDGKPLQILSGEMHYPRIPRAYWRDRFRMAKAMGLNSVTTYVFWNEH